MIRFASVLRVFVVLVLLGAVAVALGAGGVYPT